MHGQEYQNGDGIEGLKALPDNSIDLLLTDPPYGVSKGKKDIKSIRLAHTRKPSKQRMHFGKWDELDEGFEDWLQVAIPKVRGWIIIFCSIPQTSPYYKIMQGNGMKMVTTFTWIKPNPAIMLQRQGFLRSVEQAVCGKKPGAYFLGGYIPNVGTYQIPNNGAFADAGLGRIHPTQKPLTLFEDLVLYCTDKNGLVYDPFCGSGTAAIAAMNLGRHVISYELDKKIYGLGRTRIDRLTAEDCKRAGRECVKRAARHIEKIPVDRQALIADERLGITGQSKLDKF